MPKSEVKGDAEFKFGLTLGVEIVLVLYREDRTLQTANCNYTNQFPMGRGFHK
jgi:hypothetical protein